MCILACNLLLGVLVTLTEKPCVLNLWCPFPKSHVSPLGVGIVHVLQYLYLGVICINIILQCLSYLAVSWDSFPNSVND